MRAKAKVFSIKDRPKEKLNPCGVQKENKKI